MNPLHWTRQEQIAIVALCVLGAMSGIFFAWMESAARARSVSSLSGEWADYSAVFLMWLRFAHYWPWPVLGALSAGLATYAVQLLRIAPR